MVTYEDIKKANNAIQTTNIKDKEYAEVNQRIKAFRMCYPEGFINTNMIEDENGKCIVRAQVGFYAEDGQQRLIGSGYAYEKEGSSFINKTSYIENCETSAVGRALGMAGFGIDTSVASAEEVQNAIINQRASQEELEQAQKSGVDLDKLAKYLKKDVQALTSDELKNAIETKRKAKELKEQAKEMK